MPKILIFAPCDKVIVSEQDNTTSLISLIEAFTIGISEDAEVPEDASIPLKWHILALWERLEGEEGKNFEQRTQFILPNGREGLGGTMTLDFKPESKRFRAVSIILGFPVSPSGACVLKLSVREVGQEDWQDVADYSIYITRVAAPAQEAEVINETAAAESTEVG